jgi:hypothetical protein
MLCVSFYVILVYKERKQDKEASNPQDRIAAFVLMLTQWDNLPFFLNFSPRIFLPMKYGLYFK